MAAMAKVDREAPYPSGLKNQGVAVDTATGAGDTSTEIVAAVASTQHHIIGGYVSMDSAGELAIFSDTTKIGSIELAAAGTLPLPPAYTKAGEALKMQNVNAVTNIFIYCESIPITSGQYAPITG